MEDVIFLFYKHYNTFKGKKRSTFFPSFIYENYIVPIDEYTFESLLRKIEIVYHTQDTNRYNQKPVKLFEKIVTALSQVNVNEFE